MHTFQQIYSLLRIPNVPVYVRIQNRKNINNYGEIYNCINPADKDPWDIIVPGYKPLKRDTPIMFKKLEGVMLLPNGNHKLIIDVHTTQKRKGVKRDVERFRKLYEEHTKLTSDVIYF